MKQSFVTTFAHAKINLALAVLGIRDDGYHELQSVMQSIDLHDVVRVRRAGEKVTCHCGELSGSGNIAHIAAELFLQELGLSEGVEIHIEKHIPIQAGLAGGSSDAAATLRLLNKLFDNPLTKKTLLELAGKCGADVAFCLGGGTMWAAGRGEELDFLPKAPCLDLVLVKPRAGVNTREAYQRFDRDGRSGFLVRADWENALRESSPQQIAALLYNDLEIASIPLVPEISDLKQQLLAEKCYGALMSGSGSCVFGIAQSGEHARQVAEKLKNRGHKNVWVTKTADHESM
ncbi:4-diphosphocytidyl-2-C-methyl-D-erythritol kinase [Desulfosporosinus acidiphilus SJ4]|uniref:4-diphosphocytidyl-2-C-methyl-D-erythritol kinase n=1 Tax=Desulfosporosinus acidiphilus (strain DSM 22704 / JCM 16185 / SJ4) TaxID=646529 RepID=I4D043_DESAJ|nr:4-(cytidine 5'-diphospho)-2-C-methyl-D-erythritol kinase [Desulfosporosinus acidiphilus]AFM39167.1 4-diphosphocytidyl-2-C-methyl-D-erythritol kinase [Desulfosporosinus acidiphilus SJ4]